MFAVTAGTYGTTNSRYQHHTWKMRKTWHSLSV